MANKRIIRTYKATIYVDINGKPINVYIENHYKDLDGDEWSVPIRQCKDEKSKYLNYYFTRSCNLQNVETIKSDLRDIIKISDKNIIVENI